jgi:hypothetical protein
LGYKSRPSTPSISSTVCKTQPPRKAIKVTGRKQAALDQVYTEVGSNIISQHMVIVTCTIPKSSSLTGLGHILCYPAVPAVRKTQSLPSAEPLCGAIHHVHTQLFISFT